MRLLIVEDNLRIGRLIAEGLGERGFACDTAGNIEEAEASLASAQFDAMVLDLGLPDGDGREWLARQEAGQRVPTIILTARGGLQDRIDGLNAGADDYLAKPFDMDELAARIRALLRRPGARAVPVLQVGALRFDTVGRSVHAGDTRLDLTRREEDLLELLMRKAGQVVRRGQIEEAIYTFQEPVTPNAIEAIISRLRRKLEEAGCADRLHTVRGVGYLLREA